MLHIDQVKFVVIIEMSETFYWHTSIFTNTSCTSDFSRFQFSFLYFFVFIFGQLISSQLVSSFFTMIEYLMGWLIGYKQYFALFGHLTTLDNVCWCTFSPFRSLLFRRYYFNCFCGRFLRLSIALLCFCIYDKGKEPIKTKLYFDVGYIFFFKQSRNESQTNSTIIHIVYLIHMLYSVSIVYCFITIFLWASATYFSEKMYNTRLS